MFRERNVPSDKIDQGGLYSESSFYGFDRDVGQYEKRDVMQDGCQLEENIQQDLDCVTSLDVTLHFPSHCDIENVCQKEGSGPHCFPQLYDVICPEDVGAIGGRGIDSSNLWSHLQEWEPSNLSDLSGEPITSFSHNQQVRNFRKDEDGQMVQHQDVANLLHATKVPGEGQTLSYQLDGGLLEKNGALHSDITILDHVMLSTGTGNTFISNDDGKLQIPTKFVVKNEKSFGVCEREDFFPDFLLKNQGHTGAMKTFSMNEARNATRTGDNSAKLCERDSFTRQLDDRRKWSGKKGLLPDRIIEAQQGTLDIQQNHICGQGEGFEVRRVDNSTHGSHGNFDCTALYAQGTVVTRQCGELNNQTLVTRQCGELNNQTLVTRQCGELNNQAVVTRQCGELNNQTLVTRQCWELNNQTLVTRQCGELNNQAVVTRQCGELNNQTLVTRQCGELNNQTLVTRQCGELNNQAVVTRQSPQCGKLYNQTLVTRHCEELNNQTVLARHCGELNNQTVVTEHCGGLSKHFTGETWCQVDEDVFFKLKPGQSASQFCDPLFLNLTESNFDSSDELSYKSSMDMSEEEELLLKKFITYNPCLLKDFMTMTDGKSRDGREEHDKVSEMPHECSSMTEDRNRPKHYVRQIGEELLPEESIDLHQNKNSIFLKSQIHQRSPVIWHRDSCKDALKECTMRMSSSDDLRTDGLKGKLYADSTIECPTIYWHYDNIKGDGPCVLFQGQDGPVVRVNEHDGPVLQAQRQDVPDLRVQRHDGPGLQAQGRDSPGLQVQRRDGPGLQVQRRDGLGLQVQRHDGPGLQIQGHDGPGLQAHGHDGPGLQVQRHDGPGLQVQRRDGPGLQVQRHDGPCLQVQGHDGPGLQVKGHDGPGLQDQRQDGPGLQVQRQHGCGLQAQGHHSPGFQVYTRNQGYGGARIQGHDGSGAQIQRQMPFDNQYESQQEKNAFMPQKKKPDKADGILCRSKIVNASDSKVQVCSLSSPVIMWHNDVPERREMETWLEVDENIFFKINNWSLNAHWLSDTHCSSDTCWSSDRPTHNCESHHNVGSCCYDCLCEPSAESPYCAANNCHRFLKGDRWNLEDLIVTLDSIRNYLPSTTSSTQLPSDGGHSFHEHPGSAQSNLGDNEQDCLQCSGGSLGVSCDGTNPNNEEKGGISVCEYENNPLNGSAKVLWSKNELNDVNRDHLIFYTSASFHNAPKEFTTNEEVPLKFNTLCPSAFYSPGSSKLLPFSMGSLMNEDNLNAHTSLSDRSSLDGNLYKLSKGDFITMQQQTHKSQGQGKARGQGQNRQSSSQKPKVFESYWSEDKVSHGIKTGQLIVDGLADVFIDDMEDRNRALNTDEVVVLPYSLEKWRVNVEEFEEYKEGMNNQPQASNTSTIPSSKGRKEYYDSEDSDPDVIIESDDSDEISVNSCKERGGDQGQGQGHHNSTPLETSLRHISMSEDSSHPSPKQMSSYQNSNQQRSSDVKNVKCLTVAQMRQKYSHDALAMALFGPDLQKVVTPVSVGTSLVAKFLQVTGKVVFIYEKKHSRAASGHIKHMSDKNKILALFAPLDSRVPRIIIPMSDCPKEFADRPDDFVSTLFIARITSWEDNSKMPKGNLARSIGEAGQIEPETEAMLIEMDVDYSPFSDKVLACLPQDLPWTIPQEEIVSRKDLRSSCIFTIDPSTARDLDDAVSCEELGNGHYKVGVHIADVSYFVSEGTDLDKVASERATSVYLVQKVVPMLPRLLCEELCSLNPGEDRLAFSVEWIINEQGEICEEWYGRTIIRSCVKLSYDHAQGFIDQPDKAWTQQELPPISKPFTIKEVVKRVLTLNRIAVALRKQRFDNGALRLDQVKLSYTLDKETGLPNATFVYQQKDSNRLIEEFMLLANMAVAHRIKHCFPKIAILRRHPAPQNKPLQVLEELCESLGLELNTSTAGTLQESLRRYYAQDEFSLARVQVLVALISKPMQNARYFCTGTLPDEAMYHHYALNVPLYTHFTSPIRRYADVMVHRLLSAAQGYSSPPSTTVPELQKKASHCNDKKFNAKIASDRSSDMYFALYVKEVGQMEGNGMVMAVLDKSFDVLILAFGVIKRVYLEHLPLLHSSFAKRHKSPELKLVWAADEKCDHRTHHLISLFTMVECVIFANKEPLRWSCIIRRPKEEIKSMTD